MVSRNDSPHSSRAIARPSATSNASNERCRRRGSSCGPSDFGEESRARVLLSLVGRALYISVYRVPFRKRRCRTEWSPQPYPTRHGEPNAHSIFLYLSHNPKSRGRMEGYPTGYPIRTCVRKEETCPTELWTQRNAAPAPIDEKSDGALVNKKKQPQQSWKQNVFIELN